MQTTSVSERYSQNCGLLNESDLVSSLCKHTVYVNGDSPARKSCKSSRSFQEQMRVKAENFGNEHFRDNWDFVSVPKNLTAEVLNF